MTDRFAHRANETEIMDDLSCSGETVNKTLTELDVINKWLGGNSVTIEGIKKLLKEKDITHSITIADLGCGSGNMLRLVNEWALKKKYPVSLTGIDANPNIISFAKQHLKGLHDIKLVTTDILSEEFKMQKFDIVIATLFFHHFSSEQLICFLNQLKSQVRIGIIINDIHRHWFGYHSIRLITKFFSRSSMVKYDAPLSVLRAFSKKELIDIVTKAGITNFTIQWCWAFRWKVIIKA